MNARMMYDFNTIAGTFRAWKCETKPPRSRREYGDQPTASLRVSAPLRETMGSADTSGFGGYAARFLASSPNAELGEIPEGKRLNATTELCKIHKLTLAKEDKFDELKCMKISEINQSDSANLAIDARGAGSRYAHCRVSYGAATLSTVCPNGGGYFFAFDLALVSEGLNARWVTDPPALFEAPLGYKYSDLVELKIEELAI